MKEAFANLPIPTSEQWAFLKPNHIHVTYWRLNPQLTYAIDGKPFHKDVLGVGLER